MGTAVVKKTDTMGRREALEPTWPTVGRAQQDTMRPLCRTVTRTRRILNPPASEQQCAASRGSFIPFGLSFVRC